jgi:hypothetical protein
MQFQPCMEKLQVNAVFELFYFEVWYKVLWLRDYMFHTAPGFHCHSNLGCYFKTFVKWKISVRNYMFHTAPDFHCHSNLGFHFKTFVKEKFQWGITRSIQPQVSTAIQILAAILKHLWSEKFQWGITCSIQSQVSTAIQILASILKHLWRKNFSEELHVLYSTRFLLPFKCWLPF